ncbi:pyranose oxidase [Singulisphaera sp. GP187]|uniref:GMC oxidoreductase n=1 Tax=Singulisphaera sp. GP187 TaxID=1882752 RepID=UPI000929760E|nr:GMC oxidoreductase [Singulisphaera sp. GP187]SIO26879.1 pyranose oxidase [Singulisphaera sp. GP187]
MSRSRKIQSPDVLIIGAGPAGSTFARVLAQAGQKVLMLDAGAQFSDRPGRVLKNMFKYQRDLNQFTYMIQGLLHPLSVPPGGGERREIDPIAWRPPGEVYDPNRFSTRGPINTRQNPDRNLDGESVAFGVGGMMMHWTAATPRHHPRLERYRFGDIKADHEQDQRWNAMYDEAERLLGTNSKTFEYSIRNTIVRDALEAHYRQRGAHFPKNYGVQNLPMAVRRSDDSKNSEFTIYTGTDHILAEVLDDSALSNNLEILPEHRVKKLRLKGGRVDGAEVEDLMAGERYEIRARQFVVACGAVMSAYVLWNSGIKLPALGRYIIEHPIAFCQIVLRQEIIDSIRENPEFRPKVEQQGERDRRACEASGAGGTAAAGPADAPIDPLPIPMDDPPPNIWIPVSDDRPWHCQIHKDAFHYGALPPGIDDRLIVDLRWFALLEPRAENRVRFERDNFTAFGTAQPTFEFELSNTERQRMHDMMDDMLGAASSLGAFLPGTEPRFMPKGLALHIQGTTRMGTDPATSVVDEHLRVHGVDNLFVGGNGVIPTGNASNPTLTNVALALRSARHMLHDS